VISSVHFDERMGINQKKLLRPKRPGFQFVEEGRLSRQAELQRIKVC
jgi:U4/U6 small nuclear ribonucleoprotein PRP3